MPTSSYHLKRERNVAARSIRGLLTDEWPLEHRNCSWRGCLITYQRQNRPIDDVLSGGAWGDNSTLNHLTSLSPRVENADPSAPPAGEIAVCVPRTPWQRSPPA